MTGTVITGWGVLSAAAVGAGPLVAAVAPIGHGAAAAPRTTAVDWYAEPLPAPAAAVVEGLDFTALLGRKGTSTFDRATGLAVVACGQALSDSGLAVSDETRQRIGITLGTTLGSLRSTSDFSRETLVQDKPYLVNPMLFPNTVMNCAAGQAAIRFGLKGVNATVAGGALGFLGALRYSTNALRAGYADAVLTGSVEEYTPHSAWAAHHAPGAAPGVPTGEGAAVCVVERAEAARAAGRHVDAEVLAATAGFAAAADAWPDALAGCVRRALAAAGAAPAQVTLVVTADPAESAAVAAALDGSRCRTLAVREVFGECQAASGALQVATVLAVHRGDPARDGQLALVTGHTPDGAVGAALLRGWSR
nr:beta-ketoacyl synthase N-terminal-like domain-containing protein [Dactylosporangium thailandense]